MVRWLSFSLICLLVLPAVADEPAGANRLLVEAVKMIKAADSQPEGSEKLALLEGALAKLNEIIDRHPSSGLAVKLITDQPIGSLSMAELSDAVEKLRAEVAGSRQTGDKTESGPHLAAVSENTNLVLQIDVARLVETPFGQGLWDAYGRFMETSAGESERRAMEVLSRHLQGTVWVVLAADLSHVDEEEELEQLANELVLQFTSDTGFDIAALMQELSALRPETKVSQVRHVFSGNEYPGYQVSPPDDDPFYVLPSMDAKVFIAGLRFEPLAAAMRRYVSGDLVNIGTLLPPGKPQAQVRLGAVLPASMRERLKKMHLLEQFSGMSELPINEILGSVFEVGQVLIEARVERHVTVNLDLQMDTTFSASVFYVLGNAMLLPALELLEEKPFVSDPELKLDGLQVMLRFAFDGDALLTRFEATLDEGVSARKPDAQARGETDKEAEQAAIQAYLGGILERLEGHKYYPESAAEAGLSGRVVLRFTVRWDGEVLDPEIVDIAGHDSFGKAALQSLDRLGSLPPFPEDIRQRELTLEVPLTYSIDQGREQP